MSIMQKATMNLSSAVQKVMIVHPFLTAVPRLIAGSRRNANLQAW
jgi:hypothetical protein